MEQIASEPAHVLVIDDDPGDALLTQESLGAAGSSRCHIVARSEEALSFLRRAGTFADAPRPRLVLLDLNLGETHGLELLAKIKSDSELLSIPVVVLSSSRHPADIDRSYALHANAYVVKPVDLDAFTSVVKTIDACFLKLIEPVSEQQGNGISHHPVISHHPLISHHPVISD
jgi:CheY-like chemotaxis protein